MLNKWLMLALFIVVCFAAAGIGSIFTNMSIDTWYETLRKPAWNPPNWIFAPVWTTLYFLMALSAWLLWRKYGFGGAVLPFSIFFAQLVLNATWSGLFFGLRHPGLAFFEIVTLLIAILFTVILFWEWHSISGWLMLPYLLWVAFATVLNFSIWRMNALGG